MCSHSPTPPHAIRLRCTGCGIDATLPIGALPDGRAVAPAACKLCQRVFLVTGEPGVGAGPVQVPVMPLDYAVISESTCPSCDLALTPLAATPGPTRCPGCGNTATIETLPITTD